MILQSQFNSLLFLLGSTVLGRGEYGIVFQGLAHVLPTISKGPTIVAVKCLNSAEESKKEKFAEELKLMTKLGRHVNVLNLLGIIVDGKNASLTKAHSQTYPFLKIIPCCCLSTVSLGPCCHTSKIVVHHACLRILKLHQVTHLVWTVRCHSALWKTMSYLQMFSHNSPIK
jgi:serine/threonine protein kinase